MGLQYSDDSKALVSVFTQYRNTINIYTEDEGKDKNFYIQLFKRLLKGTDCKINDIYPLGDCDVVFKHCNENNDPKGLYVVDGDIYVIFAPKIPIANLFVLDSYCIENFVIDENSLRKFIFNIYGTYDVEYIEQRLCYRNMFDDIIHPIIDLFLNMSLEKKYCGCFKLGHFDMYNKGCCKLQNDKVYSEIDAIKNRLVPQYLSNSDYEEELNLLHVQFPYSLDTLLKIVSGKDYLIPYIRRYICDKFGKISVPNESWKFNLSKYCDLARLNALKVALVNKVNQAH